ncbi:MAG: hypothetical protein Fur0016_24710 [Anaerolineales bacterium]
MTAKTSQAQALLTSLAFFVFTLLFSYHFTFLRAHETFAYPAASPEALAQGMAPTPYQYRILIPAAVNLLQAISGLPSETLYRLLEFLFTFTLFYAFRAFLGLFTPNLRLASLFSLSLAYVLPYNFTYTFFYPYDLPAVLFTTLGLIALYRRQWAIYYAIFILATLNRETSYFLTFVYLAVSFRQEKPQTLLRHLTAQASLWLTLKTALYLLFRHNPAQGAGLFEFQLVRSLEQLTQPGSLGILARNWGMVWVFVLVWQNRINNPFVRRALLACLAQLLILFTVGVLEELRIYGEIIPLVLAALFEITHSFFRENA